MQIVLATSQRGIHVTITLSFVYFVLRCLIASESPTRNTGKICSCTCMCVCKLDAASGSVCDMIPTCTYTTQTVKDILKFSRCFVQLREMALILVFKSRYSQISLTFLYCIYNQIILFIVNLRDCCFAVVFQVVKSSQ